MVEGAIAWSMHGGDASEEGVGLSLQKPGESLGLDNAKYDEGLGVRCRAENREGCISNHQPIPLCTITEARCLPISPKPEGSSLRKLTNFRDKILTF